jgi:hypothetical protein
MGSIYHAARLAVPADVAWDYFDRFTRAEVIPFSASVAGRRTTRRPGPEMRRQIKTGISNGPWPALPGSACVGVVADVNRVRRR